MNWKKRGGGSTNRVPLVNCPWKPLASGIFNYQQHTKTLDPLLYYILFLKVKLTYIATEIQLSYPEWIATCIQLKKLEKCLYFNKMIWSYLILSYLILRVYESDLISFGHSKRSLHLVKFLFNNNKYFSNFYWSCVSQLRKAIVTTRPFSPPCMVARMAE
jgi:hypothetical protein